MQEPFRWDPYSDQPYPLKNTAYKRKVRMQQFWGAFPLVLSSMAIFPLALVAMPFFQGKKREKACFYGMGVDLHKGAAQVGLIEELGVKHLLIRMPLWQMERVDEYVAFAKSFGEDKQILLNILQDREHIEDRALLLRDMQTIFEKFGSFVDEYQLGNAINRTKWGFFSMEEYLLWYRHIQQLRDEKHPACKLLGPSVIDFEFHYTIRTLFNFFRLQYDKLSALLYVDRRGSPYSRQMGIFDTKKKIDLLYALARLSPKTSEEIYITEVNWPLSNTAPYAPTSERECVSEEAYMRYMLEYHAIAHKSGKIARIYWHQLIAAGYGLVDDRGGKMRKTPAFEAYKRMITDANT